MIKTHRISQPTFTRQHVTDAYVADRIDSDARLEGQTPEQLVRVLFRSFDRAADLVAAKLAQYRRGKAILQSAALVVSPDVPPGTPEALAARAAIAGTTPIVQFHTPADAVRYVTLRPRT